MFAPQHRRQRHGTYCGSADTDIEDSFCNPCWTRAHFLGLRRVAIGAFGSA